MYERPVRKAEFRLRGLDPSVTIEELRETIAKADGYSVSAVSISGIRRLVSGHRVAWISCPASVAHSLSEGRFLQVGWSSASIDSVRIKRLQCYRCWEFGHARSACRASVDRTGQCFRCGEAGHMADNYERSLVCPLQRQRDGLCPQTGIQILQGCFSFYAWEEVALVCVRVSIFSLLCISFKLVCRLVNFI